MDINNRFDPSFKQGIKKFIEFAFENLTQLTSGLLPYPCNRCRNAPLRSVEEVYNHLLEFGFMPNYCIWDHHRELPSRMGHLSIVELERMIDDMPRMLTDLFRMGGMEDSDPIWNCFWINSEWLAFDKL